MAFQLYIVDDGTYKKGGQVTKPTKIVKMRCRLLYIIQVKGSSWPYLISKILVAYKHTTASDWPCTFLQPGCFVCKHT